MTWQLFEIRQADGQPMQLMLDDRFRGETPGAELPTMTRLRLWCKQAPDGYYWHPDESSDIEEIEESIVRQADELGDGWVVYVARRSVPGRLDYHFYSGGTAALDRLLEVMQAARPDYRFEMEGVADPAWRLYGSWFAEAMASAPNADFMPQSGRGLN